jgi:hypothetical protein
MAELGAAVEKGLQKVTPVAEKDTVAVKASWPLEGKKLWAAFVDIMMPEGGPDAVPAKIEATPGLFFQPPGAYPRGEGYGATAPSYPGAWESEREGPKQRPGTRPMGPTSPGGAWNSTQRGEPLPPPTVGGSPMPPPPPPPSVRVDVPAKLTVANVRKEVVLLFRVDPQGELTFVKKLPAGEVADLKATTNERWTAVFLSGPHHVKYVVLQPEAVWLLR